MPSSSIPLIFLSQEARVYMLAADNNSMWKLSISHCFSLKFLLLLEVNKKWRQIMPYKCAVKSHYFNKKLDKKLSGELVTYFSSPSQYVPDLTCHLVKRKSWDSDTRHFQNCFKFSSKGHLLSNKNLLLISVNFTSYLYSLKSGEFLYWLLPGKILILE